MLPDHDATVPLWRPSGPCVIVGCDIAGFGDAARTDDVRRHMRDALYRHLDVSLSAAGVLLADCYWEDRGDGAMIALRPHLEVESVLVDVADTLRAELGRHNRVASEIARIRLRMAVHTGEAVFDGHGLVGTAVNHAFRILDAPAFKDALAESGAWFGLVVSERVHSDVVRHARGRIIPEDYRRIEVSVKETDASAWVRLPGAGARSDAHPYPAAAVSPTPSADAPPRDAPGRPAVFDLVDRMLEVPLLSSPQGRDQVVGALRRDVAAAVTRHTGARMDCFAILTTCLDYPGGLKELVDVTRGLAGESLSVHRLEQAMARIL
ncbi:effector-associated domain 2-containing protein [Spirillospora sp. CA-108201]